MKALELTGRKFGRLTVKNKNPIRSLSGKIRWNCICDCGNETVIMTSNLTTGHTTSCGCYQKEQMTTHGMYGTLEHNSWNSMIQRCTNSNEPGYSDYGGRGITVCDRWLNSFEAFYEDMGPRPSPNHSIDRIEVDGNYEKNNCRWATELEQQNNKRNNIRYPYKGQQYSIQQLTELPEAKENGLNRSTLTARIKRSNYSIEEAVNKPIGITYTHNGVTKTIGEWVMEYGIEYDKLYYRLITRKWDFDTAINTP